MWRIVYKYSIYSMYTSLQYSCNIHTSMNENVSLQVVSTPEGPVTVVTDKVLLDFWKWTISIFIHNRLSGKRRTTELSEKLSIHYILNLLKPHNFVRGTGWNRSLYSHTILNSSPRHILESIINDYHTFWVGSFQSVNWSSNLQHITYTEKRLLFVSLLQMHDYIKIYITDSLCLLYFFQFQMHHTFHTKMQKTLTRHASLNHVFQLETGKSSHRAEANIIAWQLCNPF